MWARHWLESMAAFKPKTVRWNEWTGNCATPSPLPIVTILFHLTSFKKSYFSRGNMKTEPDMKPASIRSCCYQHCLSQMVPPGLSWLGYQHHLVFTSGAENQSRKGNFIESVETKGWYSGVDDAVVDVVVAAVAAVVVVVVAAGAVAIVAEGLAVALSQLMFMRMFSAAAVGVVKVAVLMSAL